MSNPDAKGEAQNIARLENRLVTAKTDDDAEKAREALQTEVHGLNDPGQSNEYRQRVFEALKQEDQNHNALLPLLDLTDQGQLAVKKNRVTEQYGPTEGIAERNAETVFPHNAQLQQLEIRDELGDIPGNKPLSAKEQAQLYAGRKFTDDPLLQQLVYRDELGDRPDNQPLNSEEQAKLLAAGYDTTLRASERKTADDLLSAIQIDNSEQIRQIVAQYKDNPARLGFNISDILAANLQQKGLSNKYLINPDMPLDKQTGETTSCTLKIDTVDANGNMVHHKEFSTNDERDQAG